MCNQPRAFLTENKCLYLLLWTHVCENALSQNWRDVEQCDSAFSSAGNNGAMNRVFHYFTTARLVHCQFAPNNRMLAPWEKDLKSIKKHVFTLS